MVQNGHALPPLFPKRLILVCLYAMSYPMPPFALLRNVPQQVKPLQ